MILNNFPSFNMDSDVGKVREEQDKKLLCMSKSKEYGSYYCKGKANVYMPILLIKNNPLENLLKKLDL